MAILIFIVVLCVLILVHEFGHFIAAKKFGMRVDEFAIGFPPRFFARQIGETVYSFNVFLIGGFVKILGENGEGETRTASAPAASEAGEGGAIQSPRSFSAKPKWQQAVVLVAGVAMNILLAWLIFIAVLMMGTENAVKEGSQGADASLIATLVLEEGPAYGAGMRPGSRILEVESGGKMLAALTPSAFQTFVSTQSGDVIEITYEYKGERKTAAIVPQKGLLEETPEQEAVGVALALVETTAYAFPAAVREATKMTYNGLIEITVGIAGLLADAVRFDADLTSVAGPVGIVGLVEEASAFGLTTLLMFAAFISLNLAVINLLPFPALDGGRLLFVLIEAVKGSPIKPSFAGMLNTIGFALLVLLMLAVTYNDILRLLSGQ